MIEISSLSRISFLPTSVLSVISVVKSFSASLAWALLLTTAFTAPSWAASPYGLSKQAEAAFKAGDAAKSLALYRQALAVETAEKRKAILHFDAGACLLFLGRDAEARDEFTLALAAPDSGLSPSAFYNLAHALAGLGDRASAMEALRACLVLDPSRTDAKKLYEWLLKQEPPEQPPPSDEPPPPSPQAPPPPMPNILEQLPSPPPKDAQDQMRPPTPESPPGMKPW